MESDDKPTPAPRSRTAADYLWRLDVRALAVSARRRALEQGEADENLGWIGRHAEPPPASLVESVFDLRLEGSNQPRATLLVWARADLSEQTLELEYEPAAHDGELRQTFGLEAEPCHFGGDRLWVRCRCGRRARIMYGPQWACVKCLDLLYATERMDKAQRMISRARKIRLRVDRRMLEHHHFAMRMGMPIPLLNKPQGMWWSKFDRTEERLYQFEQRAIALSRAAFARLGRRTR